MKTFGKLGLAYSAPMKRAIALSPIGFVGMFGIGIVELAILAAIGVVVVVIPLLVLIYVGTRKKQ